MKIFYDPEHILYIAGYLREFYKILTKGFSREFLPGCLTEHCVHHLVRFSVGISVRCCTECWVHVVFLAEIFSGCYDLLLNGRKTVRNMFIVNIYIQGLPSHYHYRSYVQIYLSIHLYNVLIDMQTC